VTIPAHSTSSTRSAWGGRFQRLLQFELPNTDEFYIRFALYHELGRHPILVAGNEKSKAFFWDLQRLENSGTGEDASHNTKVPHGLPRLVREGSFASTGSSAVSGGGSGATKAKKKKMKEKEKEKEQFCDRGISDPFRSIKAHKIIEIPKYQAFPFRHFAFSRDGQWCVGAGDCGFVNVFHRWENGVPPINPDKEIPVPEEEPKIS
jgi:polycomb protein EED